MRKKQVTVTALICVAAVFMGLLGGCTQAEEPMESRVPTTSSEPETLASYLGDALVEAFEDKGMTLEEIATISPAAGYLAARVDEYRGFICVPSEDGADDYAYLYDNAAAIIALSHAGAHWYAQQIADAIVYAMGHDRTFSDGRLRNAYVGGNPSGDSGWSFVDNEEAVKLPGFWDDDGWQEDYHTVSTSAGNMAWTILALCQAAQNAPEDKAAEYPAAAEKAAGFVLGLRSETGGFTGGYEGWDDDQVKVTYKSTEHNIDLISAFASLATLVRETDHTKAAEYLEASEYAREFVMSMYNPKDHCFFTGTKDNGVSISYGVLPLDANSWAILALGDTFDDAELVVAFVEKKMAVGDGFDFSAGDLDGIWNEGTAQMAVCYKLLGNMEAYDRVMAYLTTQMSTNGSITAADRDGVSTGFMVSGTDVLWEYNRTTNMGATNWLAFAQMGVNPLQCPDVSKIVEGEIDDTAMSSPESP